MVFGCYDLLHDIGNAAAAAEYLVAVCRWRPATYSWWTCWHLAGRHW